MDATTLMAAEPGLSADRARALLPGANTAMLAGGITTVLRAAMFLAQLGAESSSLAVTTEYASGSEYEGRRDLGNTQPGDGKRYKGRGFIQVTGRSNYGSVSRYCHGKGMVPTGTYFVDHPELLAEDQWGWIAAIWYWNVARNINPLCDRGDLEGVTRAINGGLNGLDNRRHRYLNICLPLGDRLLPARPEPVTRPRRRGADMQFIVDVDKAECARAKVSWPGTFVTDGIGLAHVATAADLAVYLTAGLKRSHKPISIAQYKQLGGK